MLNMKSFLGALAVATVLIGGLRVHAADPTGNASEVVEYRHISCNHGSRNTDSRPSTNTSPQKHNRPTIEKLSSLRSLCNLS